MADIPNIELSRDAGTACTQTAGAASQTVIMNDGEKVLMLVDNTNATAGQDATLTFSAGDFWRAGIGDLTVVVGDAEKAVVGPFDGARFKDSDGKLTVGIAVAAEGTAAKVKLSALVLP